MSTFSSSINDSAVLTAMDALIKRVNNAQPILQAVGDDIVERSKERFTTSSGPDGQPWAKNSAVTLSRYLAKAGGSFKKNGSLSKKGEARSAGKKPLIGDSRDLGRQIFAQASDASVTVGVSPVYAAIQQFGGTKSNFPKLWGDIPARPFLPIKPDGTIYPTDESLIIAQLSKYFAGDL